MASHPESAINILDTIDETSGVIFGNDTNVEELKNKVIKTTEKGTQIKTNFLTIKKWFYEKYPSQNPFKK